MSKYLKLAYSKVRIITRDVERKEEVVRRSLFKAKLTDYQYKLHNLDKSAMRVVVATIYI